MVSGQARLFYRMLGEGPPLVVLHGGPEFDHTYLLPELDVLADSFRLIYYDQRGRGRSAEGVSAEDVGIDSEIEDLERVREHFGLDAVVILGHSWGGLLAAEYALRHPRRVSRLILMNSAPLSHDALQSFRAHLDQVRAPEDRASMRRLEAGSDFERGDIAAEATLLRLHFKPTVDDPVRLDQIVGRLRTHFTPASLLLARAIERRLSEQTWSSPDYDLAPGLRRLAVPTLVIHGEHDFIPVELAADIASTVPTARLAVLGGCGHFAYAEDPGQVHDVITDFVASG